jgi:hypothetical protein
MDSREQHLATQRQLREAQETINALAAENRIARKVIDYLAAENRTLRDRLLRRRRVLNEAAHKLDN